MKIGIISDIHGNYYALETILRYSEKIGVEHYFVLGDLIGYFHQPELVIRKLLQLPCTFIKGNHERILEKVITGQLELRDITEKYGPGHEKALEYLSPEELVWLINLPDEQELLIDDLKIKLCHGSPLDPDQYLYPDIKDEDLNNQLFSEHNYIFIGHSHYQFIYHLKNSLLINVGSVGQNREMGGLADWGILNTENKVYVPQKTPYNIRNLIQDVEQYRSNNKYLKSVLVRNRVDLNIT